MSALIQIENLIKVYETESTGVKALRGVNLQIEEGEFLAITGPSGSGKSTLLHILSGLDAPTSGTYLFQGKNVPKLTRREQTQLRNRTFGYVFQNFCLLPRMNILENVELPLIYSGMNQKLMREKAVDVVKRLGLMDFVHHEPNQLSGGQQQRVAIARALVTHPKVIFADEPTGNLDTKTGLEVMSVLQKLNLEKGMTIVLVTHEADIVRFCKRLIALRDGQIVTDQANDHLVDAEDELRKIK